MDCKTKYCRNQAAKHRSICHACKSKKYKQSHPIEYAFNTLRLNARRRNKSFSLSIDDFRKFCYETDLLIKRGRKATSYHIDRIKNELGYEISNIQPLTCSENVKKEHNRRKLLKYHWETKEGYYSELINLPPVSDWESFFS